MRIRNIKPEFFTSEDIAALDWTTRLVFIGLWSYVDDNGVGRDSERLITSQLFPLEDDQHATRMTIACSLQHLNSVGLIVRYSVDGKDFLQVTGWSKHQYIPRPNKERYPAVTSGNAVIHADYNKQHVNDMQDAAISLPGSGGQGVSINSSSDDEPEHPANRFDDFWAVYPKKVAKKKAQTKFATAVKQGADPQEVIDGAERYAQQVADTDPKFIKQPDGWLEAGRWEDESVVVPQPKSPWDRRVDLG